MSTTDIAKDFTKLLKDNQHQEAAAKYNADDIASYEDMEGPMAEIHGKEAVKAKGDWWYANHEFHGGAVEGPYVNGDQFVVRFTMDVTAKETGQRMNMDEMGVYTVTNGKIASERFYYLQV